MLPEFFTLRNWASFCLYLNNQRSYGQMDATGGFRASNRSTNRPPKYSNYSSKRWYRGRTSLTLYIDSVPRLCNSTLCTSTLHRDSAPRLSLQLPQLPRVQLPRVQLPRL